MIDSKVCPIMSRPYTRKINNDGFIKGKNPCHPVPDNSDLASNDSDRIPRDLFDLRDGR